jgi:hypothetical protein
MQQKKVPSAYGPMAGQPMMDNASRLNWANHHDFSVGMA